MWVRQQVDAARHDNQEELREIRGQIYEQLRRELSAELRAELYKKLLDASGGETVRERSPGAHQLDSTEERTDNDVNRLTDTQS